MTAMLKLREQVRSAGHNQDRGSYSLVFLLPRDSLP